MGEGERPAYFFGVQVRSLFSVRLARSISAKGATRWRKLMAPNSADTSAKAGAESAELGAISLRQRVAPLADMLRASLAENKDLTWTPKK